MNRIILVLLGLILIVPIVKGQDFKPGCELSLQLKSLRQKQKIDSACATAGDGSSASKEQNRAKNNFCAVGPATQLTVTDLKNLYAMTATRLTDAGIPFGSPASIPPNRNALTQTFTLSNGKSLAEGKLVSIVAFVLGARHSNLSNGEKVNCNETGRKNNDIHIELVARRDSDSCNSITAEISPHFRPDDWDRFDDYEFTHPVMMIGNLFFDASHRPCSGVGTAHEKRIHPTRISSWEIHPVYAIFVCKNSTIAACPARDTAKWVPFNEWLKLPDDKDTDDPVNSPSEPANANHLEARRTAPITQHESDALRIVLKRRWRPLRVSA